MKITALRDCDCWGLCPKCHRQGINVHEDRRAHWMVCKTHKLKWPTGEGLLSFPFIDDDGKFSWERGEELLKHNRFLLAGCRTVEPFYWPEGSPMSAAYQSAIDNDNDDDIDLPF